MTEEDNKPDGEIFILEGSKVIPTRYLDGMLESKPKALDPSRLEQISEADSEEYPPKAVLVALESQRDIDTIVSLRNEYPHSKILVITHGTSPLLSSRLLSEQDDDNRIVHLPFDGSTWGKRYLLERIQREVYNHGPISGEMPALDPRQATNGISGQSVLFVKTQQDSPNVSPTVISNLQERGYKVSEIDMTAPLMIGGDSGVIPKLTRFRPNILVCDGLDKGLLQYFSRWSMHQGSFIVRSNGPSQVKQSSVGLARVLSSDDDNHLVRLIDQEMDRIVNREASRDFYAEMLERRLGGTDLSSPSQKRDALLSMIAEIYLLQREVRDENMLYRGRWKHDIYEVKLNVPGEGSIILKVCDYKKRKYLERELRVYQKIEDLNQVRASFGLDTVETPNPVGEILYSPEEEGDDRVAMLVLPAEGRSLLDHFDDLQEIIDHGEKDGKKRALEEMDRLFMEVYRQDTILQSMGSDYFGKDDGDVVDYSPDKMNWKFLGNRENPFDGSVAYMFGGTGDNYSNFMERLRREFSIYYEPIAKIVQGAQKGMRTDRSTFNQLLAKNGDEKVKLIDFETMRIGVPNQFSWPQHIGRHPMNMVELEENLKFEGKTVYAKGGKITLREKHLVYAAEQLNRKLQESYDMGLICKNRLDEHKITDINQFLLESDAVCIDAALRQCSNNLHWSHMKRPRINYLAASQQLQNAIDIARRIIDPNKPEGSYIKDDNDKTRVKHLADLLAVTKAKFDAAYLSGANGRETLK